MSKRLVEMRMRVQFLRLTKKKKKNTLKKTSW